MPTALLFDLDGTLTDTDHAHLAATKAALAPHGIAVDMAFYQSRILGRPNDESFPEFLPHLTRAEAMAVADDKEARFRDIVDELAPTPGLFALLDWAERAGAPMAVVTNAPRANAEFMLRGLKLDRRLTTLVIGEELPHGKPHPLPYLTGLERLGVAATDAIAFEDSVAGVTAAHAAGIFTIGIQAATDATRLRAAGAALVIQDFHDARVWERLGAPAPGSAQA